MQTLKLADDLFPSLQCGDKMTTLRKGRRDVTRGLLTFEGADDETLQEVVNVTEVLVSRLGDVEEDTLLADGFADHDEALHVMKRFYPDITFDSEVTAISYRLMSRDPR